MDRLIRACTIVALAVAAAAPFAQEVNPPRAPAATPAPAPDERPRDFGSTPYFYSVLDAFAVKPWTDLALYAHSTASGGLFCRFGSPERRVTGQVVLPHGVRLSAFRVWGFDSSAAEEVSVQVQRACLPDFSDGLPTITVLATLDSGVAYAGGTFSAVANPPGTTLSDNMSCTVRAIVLLGETSCPDDLVLGFYKLRVEWERFIPPAPVAATFGDVPTTHPFFQSIEALAKSGVTTGCDVGLYCPEGPVTRGQMAAFLARALGLPESVIADPANP